MATMFAQPQPRVIVPPRPRDEYDEYVSSDLELSFASSISLNSPPRSPQDSTQSNGQAPVPMDIYESPTLLRPSDAVVSRPPSCRARATTTAGRTFGRDVANASRGSLGVDKQPPPIHTTQSDKLRSRQRTTLPTTWLPATPEPAAPPIPETLAVVSVEREHKRQEIDKDPHSYSQSAQNTSHDAMDIDEPSPLPGKAMVPTGTVIPPPDFGTLFNSSPVPVPAPTRKRRSMSPESGSEGLFQEASVIPARRQFDRFASTGQTSGGNLFSGTGARKPSLNAAFVSPSITTKRNRRPTLAVMPVNDESSEALSANPILQPSAMPQHLAPPPVRRAFSAFVQPGLTISGPDVSSDDGSSFEASPARAYSKRQQSRATRGLSAPRTPHLGAAECLQSSPLAKGAGMPAHGTNEADGKILPCYKVKDDGLMRIDADTLQRVLSGVYSERMESYQVIDCRFDYEYQGGHIYGAVNLNTNEAIEKHLLNSSKPPASRSGDGKVAKKVLIFHCEFSVKRAPTFAKHLRAVDRMLNSQTWPKIHYPEVYILNGGYSNYFSKHPESCEPRAYVRMDDPHHLQARNTDLGNFRRNFNRTQSYTYGQQLELNNSSPCAAPKNPNRHTAPGGVQLTFTAASVAHTRRRGPTSAPLSTLTEDAPLATPQHDDCDTEPESEEPEAVGEHCPYDDSEEGFDFEAMTSSPCPRQFSTARPLTTGSRLHTLAKGIGRSATFA